MPIYEYSCPKCGEFDVMQKITDGPLKKCPTCKSKVSKLISNPAFHLKGGGWYITDYGRKGGGDGKSSDSGASESKSDDSSSTTSEAKSEAKSEKKEKKADKKTSASAAA